MRKLITISFLLVTAIELNAQTIFNSSDLTTGHNFSLFLINLSGPEALMPSGANVTWNISEATMTPLGTAALVTMAETEHQAAYPSANFALRFNIAGETHYSLFNLNNDNWEEVANNVGTANEIAFIIPRTAISFPFTFGSENSDQYQKEGQDVKTVVTKYDSYGSFVGPSSANVSVVREMIIDDGDTSVNWWSTNPMRPLYQTTGPGLVYWLPDNNAGLQESAYNDLFTVFPNPVSDLLTIANKVKLNGITISDINGNLVYSGLNSSIDVAEFMPGVYFIKGYSVGKMAVNRFVKL